MFFPLPKEKKGGDDLWTDLEKPENLCDNCQNKTQLAASDSDWVAHKRWEEINISDPLPQSSSFLSFLEIMWAVPVAKEMLRVKTQAVFVSVIMMPSKSHAFITSPALQSLFSWGEK